MKTVARTLSNGQRNIYTIRKLKMIKTIIKSTDYFFDGWRFKSRLLNEERHVDSKNGFGI